jgi:hypothetical protein
MEEQEKKAAIATCNRRNYRFWNRAGQAGAKSTFKSKVADLKEDAFDVGASSDPVKFSMSMKAIETYTQKTYKMPDDMKHPTLAFPAKPMKATCVDENNFFDKDKNEMAKFTWKEEYKATLYKKEKYKENKSSV